MHDIKVIDGLMGFAIGDALGVPVEFKERESLKQNPVIDMIGHGAHNQPPGTWSDDSSLTFCLVESLCTGFNIDDIAERFCRWYSAGYWSARGEVFDIGIATSDAIRKLKKGVAPLEAGGKEEYDNGNGSLMRVLPLVYYLFNTNENEKFEMIHKVSAITHNHPRSKIACAMYVQMGINLLKGLNLKDSYERARKEIWDYYKNHPYRDELKSFNRVLINDISELSKDTIESSGYVVHTLEAAIWCLLNSSNYKEAVLMAVNLGEDTDTTGAIVGGLAGIVYGIENIPIKWREQIARKLDIEDLGERFDTKLCTQLVIGTSK